MQLYLNVNMKARSIEEQCQILNMTHKLMKEIEEKFGVAEEKAPERVNVTPEAVGRYDELRRRQMRRDRERLNDLGIHVDIFQSDSSKD